MPATPLRCTQCGDRARARAVSRVCSRCFAPLEPGLRRRALARVTRESIAAGPPSIWRYAALLPVAPPEPALLAPGFTPLVAAPRLAAELGIGELYLKLDTANPTHSFKDRVVAVAAAKAQELGLETLACSSTGNLANAVAARAAVEGLQAAIFCPADVEPEKLLASAALRRDDLRRARQLRRLQPADGRAVVRAALGVRQRRRCARTTPRDRRRSRTRSPSSSAGSCRMWSSSPIASGSMLSRIGEGFEEFRELGLVDGQAPRLYRRPGRGVLAGRDRVRRGPQVSPVRPDSIARSLAIGNPADGDRRSGRAAVGRRHPRRARGRDRREHAAARVDDRGLRRDGRGRDARCAPRGRHARRGRRRAIASCCS